MLSENPQQRFWSHTISLINVRLLMLFSFLSESVVVYESISFCIGCFFGKRQQNKLLILLIFDSLTILERDVVVIDLIGWCWIPVNASIEREEHVEE